MANHTIRIYDAEMDVAEEEAQHLVDEGIIYCPGPNENGTRTYFVRPDPPIVRLPIDYGHGATVLRRIGSAIARPDAEIRTVIEG